MANSIKAPRGTADTLQNECRKWRYIEEIAHLSSELFGFGEARFPMFEHTELFERGVGDGTDVVQKEMYTFSDKSGRSLTLRPEGTASVARLVTEHSLYSAALPLKLYYIGSFFRYEKPQAGRMREFHQFGAELLGSVSPAADAEIISLVCHFFDRLGLFGLRLEINSIGCSSCRGEYLFRLKEYFNQNKDNLCTTCLNRLSKNPLRILDCKEKGCININNDAPLPVNHLCDECSLHFDGVKSRLSAMNIDYTVNGRIVRGLDYYNRTVFEFVSDAIGAQSAVCGGGRYDGLTEEIGGPPLAAIGFAMGLERVLLLMEKTQVSLPDEKPSLVYIAGIGEAADIKAQALTNALRAAGISAECDTVGRSLKAEMKYADKKGVRYTVVLGDDEIKSGEISLRDMSKGETIPVKITDLADVLIRKEIQ